MGMNGEIVEVWVMPLGSDVDFPLAMVNLNGRHLSVSRGSLNRISLDFNGASRIEKGFSISI